MPNPLIRRKVFKVGIPGRATIDEQQRRLLDGG